MMFFTGIHHPAQAHRVRGAFVSVHTLANRRSSFPVRRCILDSGAFQTINLHGGYPESVEVYAIQVRRWKEKLGRKLLGAVAQDYMCEPWMIIRTGLTIAEHQRLTVQRYDDLMACDVGGCRILPVLQGYEPKDYVAHIKMYGERLRRRQWVGVGTLCKRNIDVAQIEDILMEIKCYRPDLRLHGFGIKTTALESQIVRELLFSADSMAWSWAARWERRKANDIGEAVKFQNKIATMPVQLALFWPMRSDAAARAARAIETRGFRGVGFVAKPTPEQPKTPYFP